MGGEVSQADIRWVTRWAQEYCNRRNLPADVIDDVVQDSLLALLVCARRFNRTFRNGFRSYASSRVWGAMRDAARSACGRPGTARGQATHLPIDGQPEGAPLDIEGRASPLWRRPRRRRRGGCGS